MEKLTPVSRFIDLMISKLKIRTVQYIKIGWYSISGDVKALTGVGIDVLGLAQKP